MPGCCTKRCRESVTSPGCERPEVSLRAAVLLSPGPGTGKPDPEGACTSPRRLRERSVGAMNKNLQVGLGVLLVLVGLIWILQGLNVITNSALMSDKPSWAVIGAIVAILGGWLVARAVRAPR